MNIILTGSIGHIGKPLAEILVQKGHSVTVISSNEERTKAIEAIGARAAIGSIEDPDFLSATFHGADIVYLMETLGNRSNAFFDPHIDIVAALTRIGSNYKQAIEQSGVKQAVHLSSIGADKGPGLLRFHYNAENILNQLPEDLAIKFMRPVGFYYNLLAFIQTIKTQGAIISNYGGDEKRPWVSTQDIAEVIAEEMDSPFSGRKIRYIASDEVSANEIAGILGKAIGNPDLKWVVIPDEQLLNGLLASGMNPQTAKSLVEMNAGIRDGDLYKDYYHNRPELGKIKLVDFAREFATTYNQ